MHYCRIATHNIVQEGFIAQEAFIEDHCIVIIYTVAGSLDIIKSKFDEHIIDMKHNIHKINNAFNQFNETIPENIEKLLDNRKTKFKKNDQLAEILGYPVRNNS